MNVTVKNCEEDPGADFHPLPLQPFFTRAPASRAEGSHGCRKKENRRKADKQAESPHYYLHRVFPRILSTTTTTT